MTTTDSTELLATLANRLGPGGLLEAPADRAAYERGWRYGQGTALAIARPRNPEQVAEIFRDADRAGVRVQPMGANTGLVGASNPDASGTQLVVSFERMSQTIELCTDNRSVLVDAGVTLSQLNGALEDAGLFFPIDLGADPQVGGMIATNTGGTRLLRYGAVRDHVLGLEVILPDGTVWSDLSQLRKDNRGLDWKHLFIGTSGVYGVVTRAVLSLEPRPRQTSTAWAALPDGEGALKLLDHLERELGEFLSSYEVLSRDALEITLRRGSGVRSPFEDELPPYAALLELTTPLRPSVLDLDAAMLTSLEHFLTANEDAVRDIVPQPPSGAWHLRHQVSESLSQEGHVLALDVSVPRGRIADFTSRVREHLRTLEEPVRAADFGHWGDGGTHLNLVWNPDQVTDGTSLRDRLQTEVYDLCVHEFGGSFSAEHGVGPHNQTHYDRLTHPLKLGVARTLKHHFDPKTRLGTFRP